MRLIELNGFFVAFDAPFRHAWQNELIKVLLAQYADRLGYFLKCFEAYEPIFTRQDTIMMLSARYRFDWLHEAIFLHFFNLPVAGDLELLRSASSAIGHKQGFLIG